MIRCGTCRAFHLEISRPAPGGARTRTADPMASHPSRRQPLPGATVLDLALEITVAGSFTRIGSAARRRAFRWHDPAPNALRGRTVLITGPTSGLGRATTDALARLGARLLLVGRSKERLTLLRDELVERHGEDRFRPIVADMSSLASIQGAVLQILSTEPRLDVIVDNAGAIFHERSRSPDGIELTLATMVVGPFALVTGLLPLLEAGDGARVIAVTSGGQYMQRLHLDDLEWTTTPYSGTRAYARAKRVQVTLVREWARRLEGSAVRVNAMHPGWADTPGLADALPTFHAVMGPLLRTPADGIDTIVWLATDPDAGARGGQLFLDRRARAFDLVPMTRVPALARRLLWYRIASLAGLADRVPRALRSPPTQERSHDPHPRADRNPSAGPGRL